VNIKCFFYGPKSTQKKHFYVYHIQFLTNSIYIMIHYYYRLKTSVLLFLLLLLGSYHSFSQTVLLNPAGDGGFETGASFASNGWTTANGSATARVWYAGTGQAGFTGTAAAFIGNNSTTVGTNAGARLVHLYRSIAIPPGATNIQLTFKYKQAVSDNTFDFLKVYMSSAAPVSGTAVASGLILTADPDAVITYPTFTELTATIPNAWAGATNNLIFSFTSNNSTPHGYGAIDDVSVTYTPAPDCTGTPVAGTASVSTIASVCNTDNFTLTLTGSEGASAIAYQWQSSPDGVTFTDIVGGTTLTFTTTQAATSFYRAKVTCTPSAVSVYSNTVEVGYLPACYCAASATNVNATLEKISNVALNTLNHTSTSAAGYEDFTAFAATVEKGIAQTITVTASNVYDQDQTIVFIDYNRNGTFDDPGETVYTSAIGEGPYVGTFTVPANAVSGITRMRVRFFDSSDGPNDSPCGVSTYGQVEDYSINIVCPASLPAPTAVNGSTCTGNTASLSATSTLSGVSFEWYAGAMGGPALSGTTPFTTPVLSVTTSYWAATVVPGCPAGARTEVIATIDPVNAPLTPVHVLCNGGATGSFTLGTIVCGTEPFTYSINGGAYGAIPTNLTAGTYSVIIKDAAANLSAPVSVVITQPTTTIANATVTPVAVCPGATSAIVSAAAVVNPLNTGTATIQFSQAGQPTEVSGEEPDILLHPNIISSGSFAALPAGAVVTEVRLSVPSLVPLGGSYGTDVGFGFTGAVFSEHYGGIGAPDDTEPFSFMTIFENESVNVAGGTVNLHYYDLYDDNEDAPECNFPTGNFATLTISYTYPTPVGITWWDGLTGGNQLGAAGTLEAVGTSILPNTLTPGTYQFFAQGQSGTCTSAVRTPVTVTVNAAPVPTISNSSPLTFCAGGNVTLTSSAASGNVWSNASVSQATTVNASGSYSVTTTYPNGCVVSSAPVSVTVNPLPAVPTITADGPLTFCAGGDVVLTSSAATGNSWSTAETTMAITVNSSAEITVVATDGNGCSATSASVSVIVNPVVAPTITASGPLSFCAGGSVTLTSSNVAGNTWSSMETSQSITVSTAGSYTVTDNTGCGGTSVPMVVVVNALPAVPTITADGPLTFCTGGDVVLTSSAASGNSWSNAASSPAITVSEGGTYTVTHTDANGCFAMSAPTTVVVNDLPTANAGQDVTICAGEQVALTATGTGTFSWNNGVSQAVPFTPLATATYTVTVDNGSCINTDAVTVTVNAKPVATATLSPSSDITITATPAGQSAYQWINCSNNAPVGGAISASFVATSNGSYAVIVTNASGCSDTSACISISTVGLSEHNADLPVALYPNPTNGKVTLSIGAIPQADVTVYDAQGKVISTLKHLQDGATIDLGAFETGVYVIHVATDQGIHITRILKN